MDEIKEAYEKLKKGHGLPDYNVLDEIFEISSLEDRRYLLREIRRQMINKIKANVEILEELIHPNSTISAYHETKFFSEAEKKQLYDLYAILMKYIRRSNILDLGSDDMAEAGFIGDVSRTWPGTRKGLLAIISKLRDCWSREEIADADTSSYFG